MPYWDSNRRPQQQSGIRTVVPNNISSLNHHAICRIVRKMPLLLHWSCVIIILPFSTIRWSCTAVKHRHLLWIAQSCWIEPPRDKTNNVAVRPAKTQISLGIRPVWSESSLSAWRKLGLLATYERTAKTDQTGWMPKLIGVFAGRTLSLLVLSRGGSIFFACLYCLMQWKQTQD